MANWDSCVDEVGLGTARVWGLYMAGSRLAFERNGIQLHQVLATRNAPQGVNGYPLRPNWTAPDRTSEHARRSRASSARLSSIRLTKRIFTYKLFLP